MKCSWRALTEDCRNKPAQVVLAICENGHINERIFCDMHASDWQEQVRRESRKCTECRNPYLETEIREIHPGFKI